MNDDHIEWRIGGPSGDGGRDTAHRLAAELRRIIDRLVLVDAPEQELSAAADQAQAFADRLTRLAQRGWYEGFAEAANAGSPRAFFDHSPLIGLANPLAPPVKLGVASDGNDNQWVEGRATYGAAYEGPPGCVHGGMLAAAFDEVLGLTQSLSGRPGMTGTLTVRYRKPTPLNAELTFRGQVDRVEGRKIFTSGTCHAGDLLTAEAEGIFISVDFSTLAGLRSERVRGTEEPPAGS